MIDFSIGTHNKITNIRFSKKSLRAPRRGGFNNIIGTKYCGC